MAKTKKLTFVEFKASGVDCGDLATDAKPASVNDQPEPKGRGRIYLGGKVHLMRKPEGGWPRGFTEEWGLALGWDAYFSDDLERLERKLYRYACQTGLCDRA